VVVRRPIGRFASAEVGTMASMDGREESAFFGRDKSRAPSGMLRVPLAPDQEPWTQASEEIGICGRRRSVARGTVDGRHRDEPWRTSR